MSGAPPDAVAALLREARTKRVALERLPPALAPRDTKAGYAMQDRYAASAHGAAVIGHKVGCASEASQRLMRTDGPMAGRIFADEVFPAGARIPASRFFGVAVEAEFGFRLGADLAPRAAPYARDEIADAVEAVVPLVEICDTRLSGWRDLPIEEIIADNAFAGGFVVAEPVRDWRRLDLGAHVVTLSAEGAVLGRGPGRLVMGHPLDSLAWLATHLSARGIGMRQGDLVAAGTCTGLHAVRPEGARITADFGSLGTVEFEVVA